jgi:hypothetical protein
LGLAHLNLVPTRVPSHVTDQPSGNKQWTSGPSGTALTGSQQVQLQQIRDRDQEFDADLDEIGEGIQDLHELAQGMGEEVARQNVMLNSVGQKIDGAHEHMVNVNAKMKETLEEVGRSSDKLCVDIMCIVSMEYIVLIVVYVSFTMTHLPFSIPVIIHLGAGNWICFDILQAFQNIFLDWHLSTSCDE